MRKHRVALSSTLFALLLAPGGPAVAAADPVFPLSNESRADESVVDSELSWSNGLRGDASTADRSFPSSSAAAEHRPAVSGAPFARLPDGTFVPQEKVAPGGIRYVTGGVGANEAAAMRAAAPRYGLALVFATRTGAFQADVDVTVKDHNRKELLSVVSGPILLLDLPPATYIVEANLNGATATRRVAVPARGHRQAVLQLPENPVAVGWRSPAVHADSGSR